MFFFWECACFMKFSSDIVQVCSCRERREFLQVQVCDPDTPKGQSEVCAVVMWPGTVGLCLCVARAFVCVCIGCVYEACVCV